MGLNTSFPNSTENVNDILKLVIDCGVCIFNLFYNLNGKTFSLILKT